MPELFNLDAGLIAELERKGGTEHNWGEEIEGRVTRKWPWADMEVHDWIFIPNDNDDYPLVWKSASVASIQYARRHDCKFSVWRQSDGAIIYRTR